MNFDRTRFEYANLSWIAYQKPQNKQQALKKYGLDNDQLYWRRLKIAEGGELKFKQEYPATHLALLPTPPLAHRGE